jgi:hypothetical protein
MVGIKGVDICLRRSRREIALAVRRFGAALLSKTRVLHARSVGGRLRGPVRNSKDS